jgi:hypothetical protein
MFEPCAEANTEECLGCGQEFYATSDSYQFCNACLGVSQEERELRRAVSQRSLPQDEYIQ